jgi:ATP-dependent Clp protease ATP-binding subunit ClpC
MFERFTDRARRVMALANQEAKTFQQENIAPEHIFLGILQANFGIGASVLRALGIDLQQVELAVKQQLPTGSVMWQTEQPRPDPIAKHVIESAIAEAETLHRNYVGTEHLLLGLTLMEDNLAARILRSFGVTTEEVHQLLTDYYAVEDNVD